MIGNGSGGHGDGTFSVTPYVSGTQSNDVAIADLDGDGHPDVASTDTDVQEIRVLFGDGAGFFPDSRLYPAANGPLGIAVADVSSDGLPDVLAVNSASLGFPGAVTVLLGRCVAGVEPVIESVRDVPHDQGGRVFVSWLASGLDNPTDHAITGYRVWRRILPAGTAGAQRVASSFESFDPARDAVVARAEGSTVEFWEPLTTIPAAFLEGYGYTAPTTQDSLKGSNPYTAFFVQALTPNPYVFYDSAPDSGYSVDNLPPAAPMPFVVQYQADGTALHWASSGEADFAQYRLYRGTSLDFAPDPAHLVAAQGDTGYFDATTEAYYYKLAAIDVHGNASRYSVVGPELPTATLATAVAAEVSDGQVRLTWYVTSDASGEIAVYRRAGDAPWELLGRALPDGSGYLRWEDADVVAGTTYAYRLGLPSDAGETAAGEIRVMVPEPAVDLSIRVPSPVVGGDVTVSLAMPAGRSARVELFDVGGRLVASRHVGYAAGRQVVHLAHARDLPPGLYLVRVERPEAVVRRVVVMR